MTEKTLSLEHQGLITSLCTNVAIPLSEYNFANLYLFRKVHQYQLIDETNSEYYIKGVSYHGTSFLMPLFHPKNWASCIQIARAYHADYLFPIPEEWFEDVHAQGYSLKTSEDDSDYLFDAESIRTYPGRHLDGQRNHVRGFLSNHTVNVVILTVETVSKARYVIDQWAREKNEQQTSDDVEACIEGVECAELLGLQGWIYEVDGSPSGLLLGGPLTDSIYTYHFSKTCSGYRGLTTFMHQDVAKQIDRKYTSLNWEQDLGMQGLRHSKRSYHPQALAKKGQLWTRPS